VAVVVDEGFDFSSVFVSCAWLGWSSAWDESLSDEVFSDIMVVAW
jgi:hypothetical protein